MARKNAIVKCTACGAVWLCQAKNPRCAVRTCRSTAVQRLTVAEVEALIDDLLSCLNEFDKDMHYALVEIDDKSYQQLPEDCDLSEILAKAIDADEEDEEEEPEDEEAEDEEDDRKKALKVVREEIARKEMMLAVLQHDKGYSTEKEELETELDVLKRRSSALFWVVDSPEDNPEDDDSEDAGEEEDS